MGYEREVREYLRKVLSERFGNVNARMGEFVGTTGQQIRRWVEEGKTPGLDQLGGIFDALGVRFHSPETALGPSPREIEFVNAKVVSIENGAPPPVSQDYFAVPLAEEAVAAGPGMISQDALRGWVVVWRHHDSLRFRSNLVAVEIGRGQTSMVPTLHPGDIVLVDREERKPDPDGKIMLVCDPDGGCAIKRVATKRVDGDLELIFYSDNSRENPPSTYRLNRDYGGELHHAIGGRVVWAWSDMTRK